MAREFSLNLLVAVKDAATKPLSLIFSKIGAIASAIAAFAGFKFLSGAVASAAEFEAALDSLRSILTGDSASINASMERIKETAEEMGATTKYSAVEAAGALEELVRSGLSVEEAIQNIPVVMNAAAGASISLSESAQKLTDVAANLNLPMAELQDIADVVSVAASKSASTFGQLADALGVAGGAARGAGLSMRETVALLAKIHDGGIRGAEAGNALQKMLLELDKSSRGAGKALTEVGISTDSIYDAIEGLTKQSDNGAKAMVGFGDEARKAADRLVVAGIPAVREFEEALKDVGGSAAQTAITASNNLEGSFQGLASVWTAVQNALAENLLPEIKKSIDQLSEGLSNLVSGGKLEEVSQALASMWADGSAAVKQFLVDIEIGAAVERTKNTIKDLAAGFSELANVLGVVSDTFGAFYDALRTILSGVGALFVRLASVATESIAAISLVLEKMGVDTGNASAKLNEFAKKYAATSTDLLESTKKHALDTVENVVQAAEGVKRAFTDTEEVARRAAITLRDSFTEIDAATQAALSSVVNLLSAETFNPKAAVTALNNVVEGHSKIAHVAKAAGSEVSFQAEVAKVALEGQVSEITKLVGEYDRLRASGTASQEALDQAANKIKDAVRDTAAAVAEQNKGYLDFQASQKEAAATIEAAQKAAKGALKEAEAALRDLISQGAGLDDIAAATLRVKEAQATLAIATEGNVEAVKKLSTAAPDGLEALRTAVLSAKAAYDDLKSSGNATAQELVRSYTAMLDAQRELSAAIGESANKQTEGKKSIEDMRKELQSATEETDKLASGMEDVADAAGGATDSAEGIADGAKNAAKSADGIQVGFTVAEQEAQRLITALREVAGASDKSEAEMMRLASAAERFLGDTEASAYGINQLDKATLNSLRSEIDSVRNAMQSLRDATADALTAAKQELEDIKATGDEFQQENLRFMREMASAQAQLDEAQAYRDQEAIKNASSRISILQEIHKLQLDTLRAAKETTRERSANSTAAAEPRASDTYREAEPATIVLPSALTEAFRGIEKNQYELTEAIREIPGSLNLQPVDGGIVDSPAISAALNSLVVLAEKGVANQAAMISALSDLDTGGGGARPRQPSGDVSAQLAELIVDALEDANLTGPGGA